MPLPDVGAPALTTIRFDLARATGGASDSLYPALPSRLLAGKWKFTPVPGARSATSRLAPAAFQARPTAEEIRAGFFVLDLFATDDPAWLTPWCWKVTEPYPGTTRYVVVPRADLALEYAALVEVDPANLEPLPGQPVVALAGVDTDGDRVPDWFEDLTRDQATRIADLEAAVLGLQTRSVASGQTISEAEAYTTTPIGDSPAAVQAYVQTHVETPAQAGLIGGYLGGTI